MNPQSRSEFPRKPSFPVKLCREMIKDQNIAVPEGLPVGEAVGIDVSDWSLVSVNIHPVTPNLVTPSIGWTIRLIPWWYKKKAEYGSDTPQGQWYCGIPWDVPLDGDPVGVGPMFQEFPTDASERMFLQIVRNNNAPATWQFAIGFYGLVPRTETGGSGVGPWVPIPPVVISTGQFDILARDETLYSNLKGDFTATRTGASQITLTQIPDFMKIDIEHIVAVGHKTNATSLWEIQWRGEDLDYQYAPATGILTLGNMVIGATDQIGVWVEGRMKTQISEQEAKRIIPVNLTPLRGSFDGMAIEYVAPSPGAAHSRSVYFQLAEEGYRRISLQVVAIANCSLYLEGTDQLEQDDLLNTWGDITLRALGAGSPILVAGMYASIDQLPWRRFRLRAEFGISAAPGDTYLLSKISRVF